MNPTLPPALRTERAPSRSKELRRAVESAALTASASTLQHSASSRREVSAGHRFASGWQRVNDAVAGTELHRADVARPSPQEPEGTAPCARASHPR